MEEINRTVINDDVFMEIARSAMRTINEVSRQEKKGTLAELTQLVSEKIAPQIVVKRIERDGEAPGVSFDMKLTLIYGVRIPEVVEKVRTVVKTEIETMTGYRVDHIDILVDKLVRPEPADPSATDQ
jgi:uncharacterized alkaline shock family protein YloU